MRELPILACAIALVVAATAAAEQSRRGGKAEAEPAFALVDDFADGDLATATLGAWMATDDRDQGGSSAAALVIDAAGYEDDAAARLSFTLGDGFTSKAGKAESPRAFLALLMGAKFGVVADLSENTGVRFQARAEGLEAITFLVLSIADGKPLYWVATREVKAEWDQLDIAWTDCKRIGGEESEQLDPATVTLLAIGTGFELPPGTKGAIVVDDFGLLRRSEKELALEASVTSQYRFAELAFEAPQRGWSWEAGKLSWPAKGAEIEFKAFLIDGDRRVPFAEGIDADPGNLGELEERYVMALETYGVQVVERGKGEKIKIGRKRAHRYWLVGDLTPALAEKAPQLGKRAYIEVVLIKEGGKTYQIKCLLPEGRRGELLDELHRIVASVRPQG